MSAFDPAAETERIALTAMAEAQAERAGATEEEGPPTGDARCPITDEYAAQCMWLDGHDGPHSTRRNVDGTETIVSFYEDNLNPQFAIAADPPDDAWPPAIP